MTRDVTRDVTRETLNWVRTGTLFPTGICNRAFAQCNRGVYMYMPDFNTGCSFGLIPVRKTVLVSVPKILIFEVSWYKACVDFYLRNCVCGGVYMVFERILDFWSLVLIH